MTDSAELQINVWIDEIGQFLRQFSPCVLQRRADLDLHCSVAMCWFRAAVNYGSLREGPP